MYDGPIFLPNQTISYWPYLPASSNYKLLSQDAKKALKAYYTDAISRFPQRKVHNTEIAESP